MKTIATLMQRTRAVRRARAHILIGNTLISFLMAFLSLLAFFIHQPVTLAASQVAAVTSVSLPNGVAAGDVSQDSAVLWARSSVTGAITFTYGINLEQNPGIVRRTVNEPLQPMTVTLTGLTPNVLYHYRVTTAAGDTANGQFQTAAALGMHTGLRFGVSGDWRGELSPYPAVRNVMSRTLTFFVEHGDTIYADLPSPAVPITQATTLTDYRLKHSEVYSAHLGLNTLAALRANTAILATLDDHEVIDNFSGGAAASSDPRFKTATGRINDTTLFKKGIQAFQEYNPIRSEFYGVVGGDGRMDNQHKFYRYRTFGSDAAMIVLEERSFRDAPIKALQSVNALEVLRFLSDAFKAGRTILGTQQLQDLEHDLLDAQQKGITWKFVAVPEPIQNLGPAGAEDRFEGYAAERTSLLSFIADHKITNVVFVSADIHGTLVNNLTYQIGVGQPQLDSGAFDISTGSVAFDAPFGPTVVGLGAQLGIITPTALSFYNALPVNNDADSVVNDKDDFIKSMINNQLKRLGYDPIGLDGSSIKATLLQGDYIATHTFGWTEFEIGKDTQVLTVTTYGIPAYTPQNVATNTVSIPAIVSQFIVQPTRIANQVYLPVIQR